MDEQKDRNVDALTQLLQDQTDRSFKAIPINPGDYQVNGLWYCGKCNTPKQVRKEMFGRVFEPRCLCECENERILEEERKSDAIKRENNKEIIRNKAFAIGNLKGCTFAIDDKANKRVSEIAQRYADNFPTLLQENKGLLLYGPVGTGKTFYAACIANTVIDAGFTAYVTSFPRLANSMTALSCDKNELLKLLCSYDLLVIDDFGVERGTDFMLEVEHTVLDARINSGKPMILTTNRGVDYFERNETMQLSRIISRILAVCIPVKVDGADRRRTQAKADYGKVKDLLGL